MKNPVKIISLFSGLGGMDLGALGGFSFLKRRFKRLPTKIELAVDIDRGCCAIYSENIGPVLCRDIKRLEEFPEADLVMGGPPCQPFSSAGKKDGENDGRNLVPEFFKVVKIVRPKVFLMENVAALFNDKNGEYLKNVLREIEKLGYAVESRILNAADFGVPQDRKRLFVQGVLKEISDGPVWPKPLFWEKPEVLKSSWVTCREAIADLSFPFDSLPVRGLKEGERRYPKFGSGARRQIADRPMFTITAEDSKSNKMIHPWFDRPLTMGELKRGMGFPDDFIVPKKTRALGNGVPPPMAYELIKEIISCLRFSR